MAYRGLTVFTAICILCSFIIMMNLNNLLNEHPVKTSKGSFKRETHRLDDGRIEKGLFSTSSQNRSLDLESKTNSTKYKNNSNSFCEDLLLEPMTDDNIQEFYRACVDSGNHGNLEIGSELFTRLFGANVFERIVCEKQERSFVSGKDLVALASFPGSGNTWTRILLEQMTGIYTGSVHWDPYCNGFLIGSKLCPVDNVIFVKTHKTGTGFTKPICTKVGAQEDRMVYSKTVFLTRNPYDALLAEFSRVHAGKKKTVTEDIFSNNAWGTFVNRKSRDFFHHMRYWLQSYPHPVHVLVFEELQTNTLWELYRVANFVDFPVSFKTMWCIKQDQDSQEKYHRVKPDWLQTSNLYDSLMKEKLNNYLSNLMTNSRNRLDISNTLKSYIML